MNIPSIVGILLLLLADPCLGSECYYVPTPTEGNPFPELSLQGDCVEIDPNGNATLKTDHLKSIAFPDETPRFFILKDQQGLKAFYVSDTNRVIQTHLYENGPDYFSEGLVRIISNGKFGFADKNLVTVVPPTYDFAFPFGDGRATVCMGCAEKTDGEHSAVLGGKWGQINRRGEVVIPLTYSNEGFYDKTN